MSNFISTWFQPIKVAWYRLEKSRSWCWFCFHRTRFSRRFDCLTADARPFGLNSKICSHFEAVTSWRPQISSLDGENYLKEKILYNIWGVRSSSTKLFFSKSEYIINVQFWSGISDQKIICHGFIHSRGLTIINGKIPDTTCALVSQFTSTIFCVLLK